ncbi:MAG: hypothetical protein R3253_05160 [Longimicrobiales bacterium]|nr:hypothetical protein [Longimicrobiales bacterium]
MNKRSYRGAAAALSLIVALGVAACGDDIAGLDEDHPEAASVQLVMNAQVIATFDFATNSWTGEMEVAAGAETPHIAVNFLDEGGAVIDFESDPDTYLAVEVEDESIAEFEQDTPGEFGGHLHGVAAGETDVTFMLMHGAVGSGHADLVTAAVHAHVN